MNKDHILNLLEENNFWKKNDSSIWLASSFFLQRNLSFSFFPAKMQHLDCIQTLSLLKRSLLNSKVLDAPYFFETAALKAIEREFIFERFLTRADCFNPGCKSGFVIDKSGRFLAIINGKDHLNIRLIDSHSNWNKSWNKLTSIEAELSKHHPFAYSYHFGYLTSQPSKSGTALTVQAFLHLPSLIQLDQIGAIFAKELDDEVQPSGLMETDELIGDIVILQNSFTLGLSEQQILETIHKTAKKLIYYEKILRDKLMKNPATIIIDKMSRAIGILRYSYQIEIKEALSALSFIKLGINLGWINGLTDYDLNHILLKVCRAHLSFPFNERVSKKILAQKRAKFLQSALKSINLKR